MKPCLSPVLVAIALAATACSDPNTPGTGVPALAGFLNATAGKVDVEVDGQQILSTVDASVVAPFSELSLAPGQHQMRVWPAGSKVGGALLTLTVTGQSKRNVVAYMEPASGMSARVLEDTGAFVPAGKSKVRVINLAPNSDIDIWRTQPDWQTGIRFQFPFPFDPEPGPYFQSDAGDWQVWITPTSSANTRLHETGRVHIPSGERRTIVVVDSAGTLRLRVLID